MANLTLKRKGAIKIAITTNEILIPKKLFQGKVDKELEFDTTLADFCPDIARLIRVDCTPFIQLCEIQGDKVVTNGKAVYDILYETDYKNRLKFCSFTQDFSQSIPVPKSNAEDISAFCNAKCERINCKLLSPRRMVLKANLGIDLQIEGETPLHAIAVAEDGETFFRKKTIGFQGRNSVYTENYSFSDSIALNRNEKNLGEIVFGNVVLHRPQINLSPSRAEIKANAEMQILCEEESDEGKYFLTSKILPIEMVFQNDAIADFKQISVDLEPIESNFVPELDQYGENRIIKADFSVKMTLKAAEPKAFTVAEDLFEKDFDSIPIVTSTKLPSVHSRQELSFSAEAKFEDITPAPQRILQSTVRERLSASEIADGGVNLKGSFVLTMLLQTAEGIYSLDRDLEFSQLFPWDLPEECNINAEIHPVEVISNLHSDGSISAKVIAEAKIALETFKEESFVSDLGKRVAREKESDDSDLIYRFIQRGEDLWSVAKSYRVSPESILESNPESFNETGKAVSLNTPIVIKL